jgi:hypothetical protein
MTMSRRAYAKRRNVSHWTVNQKVASGQIPLEADGRIDPQKADVAWPLDESTVPGADIITLAEAQRRHEVLKAKERELKVERLKGALVDRSKATAHVFALAREERDSWLGWPARVAALIGAELGVPAAQVQTVLERHVREHLGSLRELRIELA